MKKGGQDVKAIYFNVYKQDNVTGNGPTHTWKNFNLREDIIFDKRPEQLSVNEFIDLTNLVSHDLNN